MIYRLITVLLCAFIFLTSCGNKVEQKKDTDVNVTEDTNDIEAPILLGEISKDSLTKAPYANWFNENYTALSVEDATLATIENNIDNYTIEVFMGTWCSDSQREVPQLFNLLEQVEFPMSQFSIIAVDEDKVQPEALLSNKEINYVPTIIFKKDGREVNRFVESAQETLVQDIAKIVTGEEYTNIYAE